MHKYFIIFGTYTVKLINIKLNYTQEIKLEFCTIALRNDGIIENRFSYEEPYEIDAHHVQEIADTITLLSQGKQCAVLNVAGLYGSMTPEARKVDINGASQYTLALAIVISELHQRLLANFYFKLKQVNYPIKTFKSEEDAVEWLHHQVRLNQKVG